MMASSSRNASKTYLWTVQSVQITSRLPKSTTISDPPISFTEEALDDSTILMMMP